MSYPDILASICKSASVPGREQTPAGLIEAVGRHGQPVAALSDPDTAAELFEALKQDCGFVDEIRGSGKTPTAADADQWVALVRWFVRELKDWTPVQDPEFQRVSALFVISSYFGMAGDFWMSVADLFRPPPEFLLLLEKRISTIQFVFKPRHSGHQPVSEAEAGAELEAADENSDWLELSELWPGFEGALLPHVFLCEAVRCLYRFGRGNLLAAVDGLKQTPTVMEISASLSTSERLVLGVESNNPHIQFACVFQTLLFTPKADRLAPGDQKVLANLLVRVAADTERWNEWMRTFNRYPVRYPALQTPLGLALADLADSAIGTYIETISLTTEPAQGRLLVAECLSAFRQKAPLDRRKALWQLAHSRWRKWGFGVADANQYLFAIGFSELDFAVVGYAAECMDIVERDAEINGLFSELNRVECDWHASLSHSVSAWNRALSRMQPYAHASHVLESSRDDWLATSAYEPTIDPKTQEYLSVMYRL